MTDYTSILEQNRAETDDNYNTDYFIESVKNNLKNVKEPLILSLSGGVDSMVLLFIIKVIIEKDIIAIHINYNNRKETDLEKIYLHDYCKKLGVIFESTTFEIKRRDIRRTNYENYSTKTRYLFYEKMLNKYSTSTGSIILGHHKDDIIENIFHNFMNTKHLFNLSSISLIGFRLGVNLIRPLIELTKIEVYSFANVFFIPYFNDTTPNWSNRGIFRNIIMKALEKSYHNPNHNLLNVSEQLNNWSSVIDSLIVNPILESIEWNIQDFGISAKFSFEKIKDQNYVLWLEILKRIYHKYSLNCPSKKSVKNLINNLNEGTVRLTSDSLVYINGFILEIKINL